MKQYPPPLAAHRRLPPRIPRFHAVPTRARRDGWTPLRQAEFIGHLAETRSVAEAARRLAMARETAYRLRRRPGAESFNAAWDAALGLPWKAAGGLAGGDRSHPGRTLPRKVTDAELMWRVETGVWRVRMNAGRYIGVSRKPDNSALLSLTARLDAGARLADAIAWG